MIKVEKGKRKRVRECLIGAGSDLDMRNRQLDATQKNNLGWEYLWTRTMKAKKEMRHRFEAQIQNPKKSLKEYQGLASNERCHREEVERLLLRRPTEWRNQIEKIRKLKEHILCQNEAYDTLKNKHI